MCCAVTCRRHTSRRILCGRRGMPARWPRCRCLRGRQRNAASRCMPRCVDVPPLRHQALAVVTMMSLAAASVALHALYCRCLYVAASVALHASMVSLFVCSGVCCAPRDQCSERLQCSLAGFTYPDGEADEARGCTETPGGRPGQVIHNREVRRRRASRGTSLTLWYSDWGVGRMIYPKATLGQASGGVRAEEGRLSDYGRAL